MDKYHDCGHRLRIHDKRLRQTANSGLVDRAGRWRIYEEGYPHAEDRPTNETYEQPEDAAERCRELNERDGPTKHWIRKWECVQPPTTSVSGPCPPTKDDTNKNQLSGG